MRNLKKVMALILVFALSLTMMASAAYTDVKAGSANEEAIGVLSALGVIKGYTNGEFRPDNNITRAEVSTIIYRLMTNDVVTAVTSADTQFPDVPNTHWASGYIKYATALDPAVILGRTSGEFDPEDNVTIAEAATLIVRALGYDGLKTVDEGLAKAYELGLTSIAVGGSKAATRGEVAEMCFKALGSAYLRDGKGLTLDKAVFNMTAYNAVVMAAGDTTTIRAIDGYDSLIVDIFNKYNYLQDGSLWSLFRNPSLRDASFKFKTSADLFGHGVIAYVVDANKDDIFNSADKMVYVVKAPYSKTYTYDAENKGYINPAYKMETAPQQGFAGNEEFTYVNVNGYSTKLATNAALINTFAGSGMYGEYKYIDNDGDGKIEIAYLTLSFNAGQLGNSYDAYGGVEISSMDAAVTPSSQRFDPDGSLTPVYDENGNLVRDAYYSGDEFYANFAGHNCIYHNGVDWGTTSSVAAPAGNVGAMNLAYYETLLPGRDKVVYTDSLGEHHDGFMSGINRPNYIPGRGFYTYSGTGNTWNLDAKFVWGSSAKVTALGDGLVPFSRINDWGNAVEGDWVIVTPVWADGVWNYNLEKAQTVTGNCTYMSYQGAAVEKIQLDGKDYSPLIAGYMWNYDGYRITTSENFVDYTDKNNDGILDFPEKNLGIDVDGDGVYEALDGDVKLSNEYMGAFTDVLATGNHSIYANIGKSFTLVMNKAGTKFWKAMETPIASSTDDAKGNYGIITAVAGTAVNLNANNLFATPDWTVQVQMLDKTGAVNVYNTTTTWVSKTSGMTPVVNSEYTDLIRYCGTEFIKYALTKEGRLVTNTIIVDDSWTNVMASAGDPLTFNKATGYLLINASSIIADTRYQLDANTVIFSFEDADLDGEKDAKEAATYINFADLAVANAKVYADDTFGSNIKNVYHNDCVVFVNTNAPADPTTKTAIGIHSLSQIAMIENGEVKSWTVSFNEFSGAKTYKIANDLINGMAHPWAAGFTYMYTVNTATNEVIEFHEWDGVDFGRDAGKGGIYSMQLAGLSYEPTLGVMIGDIFFEYTDKADIDGDGVAENYVATGRDNFIIDTSTKIKFQFAENGKEGGLQHIGNNADNTAFGAKSDLWFNAGGSAFNPYYDLEEFFYVRGFDLGWMKYEINANGDAYVTELLLGKK